jgi:ribosomal protein L10
MPSVILPTRTAAQQLCDDLAKLLGIPDPVRYPGTERWAEPQELADGTFAVAVPRKGALAELLATLDADPTGKALVADQVDKDGKVVRAKRVTAKELGDTKAALASARDVLPEERKTVAVAVEAVKETP